MKEPLGDEVSKGFVVFRKKFRKLRKQAKQGLYQAQHIRVIPVGSFRLKHIADRYGIDLSTPVDDPGLVFRVLLSCKVLLGDA